jgi:DNA-binding MarR family transcriptional regulator
MTRRWTPMADWLVTDADAAQILWHPNKRIHLKPFLGRSNDLAGASAELGIKKTAMSYWINRLVDAGLIRVDRTEKRGRHVLTFYRCIADRLRVALKDAPMESYEAVFEDFSTRWKATADQALARSLAQQAANLELCFQPHGNGGPFTTILPREGVEQPPDDFIYYWARLWLTGEEQASLAAELNALYDKYGALSDKTRKTTPALVHLMHVRLDE